MLAFIIIHEIDRIISVCLTVARVANRQRYSRHIVIWL